MISHLLLCQAKSRPSLVAGTAFGGLLILSGVLISKQKDLEGHMLGLGASAVLAAGMGARFFTTKKFMPAGLVATLGFVNSFYQLGKVLEWKE